MKRHRNSGFTLIELPVVSGAETPTFTRHAGRSAMKRTSTGFTLIELLVVIVIISILSALLLTAVSAAMRFSRRVRTDMEVDQLEDAWLLYRQTYSHWPSFLFPPPGAMESSKVKISGDVAKILRGENDARDNNTKLYNFMTFKNYDSNDDPVTLWQARSGDATLDEHYYYCKFDVNFDNKINGTGNPNDPPEDAIHASVITWTVNGDSGKITGSWER
jgi:prepilin-type N-terminal cleavage/methylation domain-containing protein